MPTIYTSSHRAENPSEPGTYYAQALALEYGQTPDHNIRTVSEKYVEGGGFVKISQVRMLKANQKDPNSVLWTDSLQSCFPVVLKFKNGDIALYHANNASIDAGLASLLERDDLDEIQLFRKHTQINQNKVNAFKTNLIEFYANKPNLPIINVKEGEQDYGVVICYHSPSGKPIILVGKSAEENAMAKEIYQCENEDKIPEKCEFEQVVLRDLSEKKVTTVDRIAITQNKTQHGVPSYWNSVLKYSGGSNTRAALSIIFSLGFFAAWVAYKHRSVKAVTPPSSSPQQKVREQVEQKSNPSPQSQADSLKHKSSNSLLNPVTAANCTTGLWAGQLPDKEQPIKTGSERDILSPKPAASEETTPWTASEYRAALQGHHSANCVGNRETAEEDILPTTHSN